MDQDNTKLQKNAKPAAPKKAHVDQGAKKLRWSDISGRILLPVSILVLALGLFLIVYNAMRLGTPSETETMTTGMLIASAAFGALLAVTGALGLFYRKKKLLVTLAIFAIVYAVVLVTATLKAGGIALASGIAGIVLPILFIVGVDGKYDIGLVRYFREMFGETKKLTWLSGKDLFSHTLAVIVFVLAMALLVYVLDLAFSGGFGALSNIGG